MPLLHTILSIFSLYSLNKKKILLLLIKINLLKFSHHTYYIELFKISKLVNSALDFIVLGNYF